MDREHIKIRISQNPGLGTRTADYVTIHSAYTDLYWDGDLLLNTQMFLFINTGYAMGAWLCVMNVMFCLTNFDIHLRVVGENNRIDRIFQLNNHFLRDLLLDELVMI